GSDEDDARSARADDRTALWNAFRHAGAAAEAQPPDDAPGAVIDAAMRFVGATPRALALVPVEDLPGDTEQPNIPGTVDEHPNWRRRMHGEVGTAFAAEAPQRRLAALAQLRRTPPQ